MDWSVIGWLAATTAAATAGSWAIARRSRRRLTPEQLEEFNRRWSAWAEPGKQKYSRRIYTDDYTDYPEDLDAHRP